jgi:hypothetical protein
MEAASSVFLVAFLSLFIINPPCPLALVLCFFFFLNPCSAILDVKLYNTLRNVPMRGAAWPWARGYVKLVAWWGLD